MVHVGYKTSTSQLHSNQVKSVKITVFEGSKPKGNKVWLELSGGSRNRDSTGNTANVNCLFFFQKVFLGFCF